MEQNTAKRTGKFIIIGIILTIFNFVIYTLISHLILKNNDLLWVDTIISCTLSTVLAFLLHSKITWKERSPGKTGAIKFFTWNLFTALIISPALAWLFGLLTPFYHFVFDIFKALNFPFTYEFIESTGVFGFTTLITMILNYLFYDKLVFEKSS